MHRRVMVSFLVVVLVAAIVLYIPYRTDLGQARERVDSGSRIATTDCGPVEYATAGSGPAVLVIHGSGGGFDQGLLIAEPVLGQGFRAIAVSRFGYLRTPMPADASPAAQADAHACLLDALALDRVAVFGASAGAPSALELAIRHPGRVSALVLLVPAVYMPAADGAGADVPAGLELVFATALRWDFPFWAASRIARRTLIRTMLATPPELLEDADPSERARVAAMLESVLPVSARRAGMLNDGRTTSRLEPFELGDIHTPTLVISAPDDLFGTFERGRHTAAGIEGARFVGFRDGGHMLVGRQAEVARAVADLLGSSD